MLLVHTLRPLRQSLKPSVLAGLRYATTASTPPASAGRPTYDAVIIGAGPGGLTAAASLMDAGLSKVCMIDPDFTGGRINEMYREVPSNTKTGLFAQWATGTNTFAKVIESAGPGPNAYTRLLQLDQEKTCMLTDAVDVAILITKGLKSVPGFESVKGKVTKLARQGDVWELPEHGISSRKVVLAQGSAPRSFGSEIVEKVPQLQIVGLDAALMPSRLESTVKPGSRVGVIGSSHSAVLAMKNFWSIKDVSIVNFYRSALLYAEYKDGWILYDNTGLKGAAADWARQTLEPGLDPRIHRVKVDASKSNEEQLAIYTKELQDCTHLLSAIGYQKNKEPEVVIQGKSINLVHDPLTGRFTNIPGLYGVGIAYPERVTDPAGNVESAVGWMKFLKFCRKVVPKWAAD